MKKSIKYILSAFLVVMFCIIGINGFKAINADAEDANRAVSVTSVDYDSMTMSLRGDGDTEYYISDANQKVWEKVEGTAQNGIVLIDISWISQMRNYTLWVKGDVSAKPVKVMLPQRNDKFRVTYLQTENKVSFNNIPNGFDGSVQWRVKGYSGWNDTTADTAGSDALSEQLAYYINTEKDITVYFRTSQIKGKSETETGIRPSKEVSVTIKKMEAMPNIKVDNDRLTVTIPSGVRYRVVGNSTWSSASLSDNSERMVESMAPLAFYSADNALPVDQIIEFRKDASESVQVSASAYVKVNAQKTTSDKVTVENLSYTGSTLKASPKSDIDLNFRTRNASASAITILNTNYEKKQISLGMNGNDMAFYSTDKVNWYSAGDTKDINGSVLMNFECLNETLDNTVYIKGDSASSESEYVSVVIPKKVYSVRASFDRTSTGEAPKLTVTGVGSARQIEWRKKDCQIWNSVSVSASGEYIIPELEHFRTKGGRIVVRAAAANGITGVRASNEYTVYIPKRSSAPVLRINPVTMTVNTLTTMEYYDNNSKKWVSCTKSMSVWDFPVVKSNVKATKSMSGTDVTVEFRKKATKNNGYSKSTVILFKGQKAAPKIGTQDTSDVIYSNEVKTVGGVKNTYHTLKFVNATSEVPYQYVVLTKTDTFDENRAVWKTVKNPVTVTLKGKKAVSGSKIYVRIKGISANAKKNTAATLPSVTNEFDIP